MLNPVEIWRKKTFGDVAVGGLVWIDQGSTKLLSLLSKITENSISHGNFYLEITGPEPKLVYF